MTCRDMTRVVECNNLKDKSGSEYNLTSICRGQGIHYTASVRCNEKWYEYDNQLDYLVDSTSVESPFSDSEHLVLIFNRYAGKVNTRQRKTVRKNASQRRTSNP
jgi:hypothetical protein